MNKIGTALTIFNNNGFEAAFKEAQKYTGYLTDEDRALLSQLDASVKAKEDAFTKTVAKFAAEGFKVLNLTNTKSGKNTSSSVLSLKSETSRNLFGLSMELSKFQNTDVLVADDARFQDDLFARGLAKVLREALNFDGCYAKKSFIAVPASKLKSYEKVFDIGTVYNLSNLLDTAKEKARQARKAAATGERCEAGDAQLFYQVLYYDTASNGWKVKYDMSYNKLKAEFAGKTIVAAIRGKNGDNSHDYYADVRIPTDKASEKTFTTSDISVKSLHDGMYYVAKNFGVAENYVLAYLSGGSYKRLKLWRDTDILLEKQALIDIYREKLANLKPVEILNYTDNLLNENNITDVKTCIDKNSTLADRQTKFYKRFAMAVAKLEQQETLRQSDEYSVYFRNQSDLRELGFNELVTYKTVTPELFADYPMLKHFGYSYGSDLRLSREGAVREMFDYVTMVEELQAMKAASVTEQVA